MLFFHRKKEPEFTFDPATQEPVVRRSICTGEMTVGYIDRQTGKFREWMRVDDQAELEAFCRRIGIESMRTIY